MSLLSLLINCLLANVLISLNINLIKKKRSYFKLLNSLLQFPQNSNVFNIDHNKNYVSTKSAY